MPSTETNLVCVDRWKCLESSGEWETYLPYVRTQLFENDEKLDVKSDSIRSRGGDVPAPNHVAIVEQTT